jgi:predicted methyltransferase
MVALWRYAAGNTNPPSVWGMVPDVRTLKRLYCPATKYLCPKNPKGSDMKQRYFAAAIAVLGLSASAAFAAVPAYLQSALSDSARPAADSSRDVHRHPGELLAFAGLKPGMTVVDLFPGGGYYTRIFAKAVGPKGRVYAYISNGGDARLKTQGKDPDNQMADFKAAYPNLGVIHGPLSGFVTPEPVDLVWTSDNYHDFHNTPTGAADVAAMNKGVFDSLKHGGIYLVVDHRAPKGAGADSTAKLHRMDEDIAKQEIEAAGFKLVAESKILTNPSDDNSKRIFDAGEHDQTDQLVLKFRKP